MSDKQVSIGREVRGDTERVRPILLAIAGDSGTGKTTLTA
ncbi:MAG: hypothetical protein QOG43_1752, partial [Actinomycetota bacterium]|nr:hypothetical protein [Actinomycetota bacterium]